jgi:hypothetical protein
VESRVRVRVSGRVSGRVSIRVRFSFSRCSNDLFLTLTNPKPKPSTNFIIGNYG